MYIYCRRRDLPCPRWLQEVQPDQLRAPTGHGAAGGDQGRLLGQGLRLGNQARGVEQDQVSEDQMTLLAFILILWLILILSLDEAYPRRLVMLLALKGRDLDA